MSQSEEASTASTEPSLIAITNKKPRTISTTVWVTAPPSKIRAAPWVRLDRPEATAASWSARSRGKPLDTASSRPSEETTTVCATPGTRSTKLVISQLRFCAAWLSSLTVHPLPKGTSVHGRAGAAGRLRGPVDPYGRGAGRAPPGVPHRTRGGHQSSLFPSWPGSWSVDAASRPCRRPWWKLESRPRTASAERGGMTGGVAFAAPEPPAEPGTRFDLGTRLGRPFVVRPAATGLAAACAAFHPSSPGDDQAAEVFSIGEAPRESAAGFSAVAGAVARGCTGRPTEAEAGGAAEAAGAG